MMNANPSDPNLDRVLRAIADPTRRAILARLRRGPAGVGDLAAPFDTSLAAVSKHIGVLERAGLVTRERVWRERRVRLRPEALDGAARWIDEMREFWVARLDDLEAALDADDGTKETRR